MPSFLRHPGARTVAIVTALVLLVPAVAMQFTPEVRWGPGDFVAAGALVAGTGAAIVWVLDRVRGRAPRVLFVSALCATLLVVWAELAVGVFG